MLLRILLPFLIAFPLIAADDSWYSKIDTKLEASLYMPLSNGTIANTDEPPATFEDDFGYTTSTASYFSLEVMLDYDYTPNFYVSYINMKDNETVTLTDDIYVADETFTSAGSISSDITFKIIDAVMYQDFMIKGDYFTLFGKKYYSGDLEFDPGLSVKIIEWNLEIQDMTDITKDSSWINIAEFIPLPYLGVKYYLYDLMVSANVSALSFSKAKATSYQASVDYRVVDGLYLSAGYLYEQFKAVEDHDTINYKTSGYKVGFKYLF